MDLEITKNAKPVSTAMPRKAAAKSKATTKEDAQSDDGGVNDAPGSAHGPAVRKRKAQVLDKAGDNDPKTSTSKKTAVRQPEHEAIASSPGGDVHRPLAKMPLKLIWIKKGGPHAAALRKYMEERDDLTWPDIFEVVGEADPRIYNQQQYRDSVRVQFKCAELGVDLTSLTLKILPLGPVDEDAKEHEINLMTSNWNDVCAQLGSAFQGAPTTDSPGVEVSFRVRALEDGESVADIFESTEPLPQIASSFTIIDGDVEARENLVAETGGDGAA